MSKKQTSRVTQNVSVSKTPNGPFFPPKLDSQINPSSPTSKLDNATRTEMEYFFGESFSAVQFKQASLSNFGGNKILAGAQDEEIIMDREISPESLLGKALLAHELTHVLQQRSSIENENQKQSSDNYEAEREASSIGWKFMNSGRGGRKLDKPVRTIGRKGQFYLCSSSRIEPPDYLGKDSRETLQRINDVVGDSRILGPLMIIGIGIAHSDPGESAAQGGPGEDGNAGAEAAKAIPQITKARIVQEIDFLMLDHQNDLNEQELAFWRRIYQRATGVKPYF